MAKGKRAPKVHERIAADKKKAARDAKISPAKGEATAHGKVGEAVDDQDYINKMYMANDIKEEPVLDKHELSKMSEAVKEKHLFMHEKAVQAYHEEQARKKSGFAKMMQKDDKWGGMAVADIIKENPMAITHFRPNKKFVDANGIGVYSVCWNSDSSMVATTGHDRSISLFRPHATNGLPARKLKGHKAWTIQACFSPDDKHIVCCSGDSVYIWDPSNGTLKAEFEAHDALINGCTWSPSGKYIVTSSNDLTSKVWLAKTALSKGKKGKEEPGKHEHMEPEFDENGNEIKHHEHGVPVEFHLPREGERGHASSVVKAAFAPNDDFVVTCGKDNLVIMWNLTLKGTKDRVYRGHNEPVLNVSVCSDGSRIASCDGAGVVIVWDPKVDNPIHIFSEHTDVVYSCVFGRECKDGKGRLITCGHDKRIMVWDIYQGTIIGEVPSCHGSWIVAAAMDSTNLQLATVSMDTRTSLVLWQSLPPVPKNWEWLDRWLRKWAKVKRNPLILFTG